MKFHESALCVLAFFASTSLATTSLAAGQDPAAAKPTVQYVRAKEGGAKLRNLGDRNGEVVLDAPAGTLMAVQSERSGWLEVEPATGMKVWIYGNYLKKTSTPGVAEINANSVRMRPLPSSDEKSFPLPMKLDKGERVRVIARKDPGIPIGEDWVQVWSPPGARAWVAASETTPFAGGEDGRTAWAAAQKTALASMPVVDVFGAGSAAAGAATANASAAAAPAAAKQAAAAKPDANAHAADGKLADAEKLMSTARASPNPDFTAAKAAYAAVIAQSSQGIAADTAHARLEEIAIREEIQRLKSDKSKYEAERAEKLADAESKLREVAKSQDPLQGRFQARGWLEGQKQTGLSTRYVVTWGGREVAEIACGNGRYELDAFVGCEVGVIGVTQRAAVPATEGGVAKPARVDATRIEVLSARAER